VLVRSSRHRPPAVSRLHIIDKQAFSDENLGTCGPLEISGVSKEADSGR
jgi:hypothetical protein